MTPASRSADRAAQRTGGCGGDLFLIVFGDIVAKNRDEPLNRGRAESIPSGASESAVRLSHCTGT